jgi:hypothetical protein
MRDMFQEVKYVFLVWIQMGLVQYNSYVIHPAFLVTVMDVCREKAHKLANQRKEILDRATKFATIQEQMISP